MKRDLSKESDPSKEKEVTVGNKKKTPERSMFRGNSKYRKRIIIVGFTVKEETKIIEIEHKIELFTIRPPAEERNN